METSFYTGQKDKFPEDYLENGGIYYATDDGTLNIFSSTYYPGKCDDTSILDKLDEIETAINNLNTTGIDTSDADATSTDILNGKTAYVQGSKVTGNIVSKEATTYNPSTEDQVISAGLYLSGDQTIAAVTVDNLPTSMKEEVIHSGSLTEDIVITPSTDHTVLTKVTVYKPNTTGTATSDDILLNKTAYVNGAQVTGNIESTDATTYNPSDKDLTISAGQYLSGDQTIAAVTTSNLPTSLQETKTVDGSLTTATTVTPSEGKVLTSVTVNAPDTTATATDTDILSGKTAYVNGSKVTGSITSKDAATYNPSDVDLTISSGQYLSGTQTIAAVTADNLPSNLQETKSVTAPLKNSTDVTPSTGKVLTKVTVNAPDMSDANVTAENLVSGVKAYDATGTLITGTHTDAGLADMTADATAADTDILSGKTAYVNGTKVTGTMTSKAAATYNPSDSDQVISAGQYLSGAQTIAAITADNIPTNLKETKTVDGSLTDDVTVTPTSGKVLTSVTVSKPDTTGTATSADILADKTAYVNGAQVTGSITSKGIATYNPSDANQTISAGQYLSGDQTIAAVTADNLPSSLTETKTVDGSLTDDVTVTPTVGKVMTGVTVSKPDTTGTATSTDILADKTAYVNGAKVTGTIATNTTISETINPGSSTTITKGYYSENGTVTASLATTLDLIDDSIKETGTGTGSLTSDTTVTASTGKVMTSVTVSKPDMSDADVTAADIVSGKKAYGSDGTLITGTHTETSGTDTTDATATADDIVFGKTAYTADGKVTGTLEVVTCYQGSDEPTSDVGDEGDLYVYIDLSISITYNLTHSYSSNSNKKANIGDSYTTTISASTDYTLNTVTVSMNGTDVTDTVYDDTTNVITIDSITGAIIITASSTAVPLADAVGTLDDTTTYGAITLNDTLDSDTYTLYYEDDTETKLDGWDAIATITK